MFRINMVHFFGKRRKISSLTEKKEKKKNLHLDQSYADYDN